MKSTNIVVPMECNVIIGNVNSKGCVEQEIEKLKGLIQEEQRCLEYCINNPNECTTQEIEEREEYIEELIDAVVRFSETFNH